MAIGTMSHYTNAVMWRSPNNHAAIIPCRVNGSGLKPGMCVTNQGETAPDVYIPDGNDDKTLGIALDRADLAMDTAFTDNDWIDVLAVRSGGGAWGFMDDGEGALDIFTAVYNTGADDDGYVEALAVTAAPTTYDDATIQGIVDYLESAEARYVGRLAKAQADGSGSDLPCKILMV